jgi:hypothetical protein
LHTCMLCGKIIKNEHSTAFLSFDYQLEFWVSIPQKLLEPKSHLIIWLEKKEVSIARISKELAIELSFDWECVRGIRAS